jgi:hypothetical protein
VIWNRIRDDATSSDHRIFSDIGHHYAIRSDPTVTSDVYLAKHLWLLSDQAVRVMKAVLLFSTQDMNVVAQESVIFDRGKPYHRVSPDVNSVTYRSIGMRKGHSKYETTV